MSTAGWSLQFGQRAFANAGAADSFDSQRTRRKRVQKPDLEAPLAPGDPYGQDSDGILRSHVLTVKRNVSSNFRPASSRRLSSCRRSRCRSSFSGRFGASLAQRSEASARAAQRDVSRVSNRSGEKSRRPVRSRATVYSLIAPQRQE